MNEYDGIEYHSDRMMGDRHAAINVKVYTSIDVGDYPEFASSAWDAVRAGFWEEATSLAHERGYSGLFSEGRSGGWMVPFYQRGMTAQEIAGRNLRVHPQMRTPLMMSWPGQGGSLGYPQYPDMDNIGERSRFRAFQRRVRAMLEGVPAAVIAEAAYQHDSAIERVI